MNNKIKKIILFNNYKSNYRKKINKYNNKTNILTNYKAKYSNKKLILENLCKKLINISNNERNLFKVMEAKIMLLLYNKKIVL